MEVKLLALDWTPFQAEFPCLLAGANLKALNVGTGWFEILWDLCADLEPIAQRQVTKDQPPLRVIQVTEKFGHLWCYLASGTNAAHALVRAARVRSETVCEACGRLGHLTMLGGRGKTLCLYHELVFDGSTRAVGRGPVPLTPPPRPEGCTCEWLGGEFGGWLVDTCPLHNWRVKGRT